MGEREQPAERAEAGAPAQARVFVVPVGDEHRRREEEQCQRLRHELPLVHPEARIERSDRRRDQADARAGCCAAGKARRDDGRGADETGEDLRGQQRVPSEHRGIVRSSGHAGVWFAFATTWPVRVEHVGIDEPVGRAPSASARAK